MSGASEIEKIRLLNSAIELGSDKAVDVLAELIVAPMDPDDPKFDEEDEYGTNIRAAIDLLVKKRRLIPLQVAKRLAQVARSNISFAAIASIVAHADRNALDVLLNLHNTTTNWFERGTMSESIENLAGRMDLKILSINGELRVA